MFIEGATGGQTHVMFTTITGWKRDYPQLSGCTYYAYVQTSDVRSQQTVTPNTTRLRARRRFGSGQMPASDGRAWLVHEDLVRPQG